MKKRDPEIVKDNSIFEEMRNLALKSRGELCEQEKPRTKMARYPENISF